MISMRRVDPPPLENRPAPQVGDFYWWQDKQGRRSLLLAVPWPAREGRAVWSRWAVTEPNENGALWEWDGNEEKPTLSPSLHWPGIWHGWVKAGIMETA